MGGLCLPRTQRRGHYLRLLAIDHAHVAQQLNSAQAHIMTSRRREICLPLPRADGLGGFTRLTFVVFVLRVNCVGPVCALTKNGDNVDPLDTYHSALWGKRC